MVRLLRPDEESRLREAEGEAVRELEIPREPEELPAEEKLDDEDEEEEDDVEAEDDWRRLWMISPSCLTTSTFACS